jgi:hypothetical protein
MSGAASAVAPIVNEAVVLVIEDRSISTVEPDVGRVPEKIGGWAVDGVHSGMDPY